MEQHPVPQHISSYQFRLVGDMTARQFAFLAGGCIIGLALYASPLAPIIKWPLIVFFVVIGVALAFMPVQERPLDQWILSFIKAIFSPTQFVWEKKPKTPDIFKTSPKKVVVKKTLVSPPDQKKLTEYLESLPVESVSPLDQQEENFVKKAINMFQLAKVPTSTPQPEKVTPSPLVSPTTPPLTMPKPKPEVSRPLEKKVPPIKTAPPRPRPKKKVVLPEMPTRPGKPKVEAKFEPSLPFPAPPSQPNTLVGMVLDSQGKIVENAIVEIRDGQSVPVRALKTNKLGQFRSVTPLENGNYEIEVEREGYQFDIHKIKLVGEVVKPLAIRAKGRSHETAQNL